MNENLSFDSMRSAAAEATALLASLANENRLLLLCQLAQGEKCVGDLEALLDLHQPSLSQHLGVLRVNGLVNTRREGKKIYYSVADVKTRTILTTLYDLFCGSNKECEGR